MDEHVPDEKTRGCLPLTMAHPGERLTLVAVRGGHGVTGRLSDMGLVPGVRLQIVAAGARGPVVVKVLESKLMLGRGLAHHVLVR